MRRLVLLVGALLLVGSAVFALSDSASHSVTLTVTEAAQLDLNNAGTIILTTGTPTAGGAVPPGSTDTSKRLFYTAVNPTGQERSIQVQASVAAPAGTQLGVSAAVEGGAGTGSTVTSIPTATAADLVTAIPSVATGTDITDGAGLTYTFSVTNTALLATGDTSVTVTYTLTDAATPTP